MALLKGALTRITFLVPVVGVSPNLRAFRGRGGFVPFAEKRFRGRSALNAPLQGSWRFCARQGQAPLRGVLRILDPRRITGRGVHAG